MYADLHIHSNYSDGVLSPAEIIVEASKVNIKYLALSDHDCIDGIEEAVDSGKEHGIEVIPSIEFSCMLGNNEVHILGYFKDFKNRTITSLLKKFASSRRERIRRIITKLEAEGIFLKYDDVLMNAGNGTVGRPHIAREIVKMGDQRDESSAFRKYLSEGKPAYVPKEHFTIEGAITAIHTAGGLAIWAHPYIPVLMKNIDYYRDQGLDGIEIYHPRLTSADTRKLRRLAGRREMIVTGGSDWHSENRDGPLGSFLIEAEKIQQFLDTFNKLEVV